MEENAAPANYGKIVFPGYVNNTIENPDTIVFVEVCNHCIYVLFEDGSDMTQAVGLTFMEDRLDPGKFNRCDHSFMVNGKFVKTLRRSNRGLWVIVKSGKSIPVSYRKKNKFLDFVIRFFIDC
jgi:DNA-binding LytR/AlgR family response regulator